MDFDDETLMAYADRALPQDQDRLVAAAIARDAALAARVEAFHAARVAVAALPLPTAPPGLEALIRARAAQPALAENPPAPGTSNVIPLRKRIRPDLWQIPLTAAAAMVAGLFLAPHLMPQPQGEMSAALIQALNSQPSGETRDGLTVISSFTDGAGALCREYATATRTGIACRDGAAWQMRLVVASGASGGYVPASSLEVIDAWMAQNEAAVPLSPEAEAAALRQ